MEVVKETKDYKVLKKRSGRFGVKSSSGQWINGKEKVEILVAEGLIKATIPAKDPEPVEEPKAEEDAAAENSSGDDGSDDKEA